MCADLCAAIWGDHHAQLYGGPGQRQNGVDIQGVDTEGRQCGAQCKWKNWPPSTLTIDEIDSEIEKAQEFCPPLHEFILLTTAPNDIKVQDHVAGLNRDKNNGIDFRVEVYSWNEIRRRLSNYPNLREKHYPDFFQKPIPAEIFDRVTDDHLNRVIGARYFGGVDIQQSALQLSERLARGDLRDASPSKRRHGLAWCARLLSVSDCEAAKSILDTAKSLGHCEEIAIADAFLTAAKGKTSDALAALYEINTSASRSAAFIIQWNNVGPKDALSWSADAGYDWKDYDNDGRTRLLLAASKARNWNLVESCLEELASVNEPPTPALALVAARSSLQLALPEEIRDSLDHSLPFFAKEFRLSSTVRANAYREQAIKLYQAAATELRSIGLDGSALVQEDFELLLRLSAPNSREEAKAELREQLKDKVLRMRRAFLALQFGIEVDRDQLIKELDQEVARSGGGNIYTGCTALAIALTAGSAQAAISEFRKRRSTIKQAIAKENLIGIEIELLARSEMSVEARRLISENRKLLGDSKIDDLDRIIKAAEGADPVALLKEQYETDGELQTLAHLVEALFDSQAWESCHEYSAELFSRTKNFADAKRHVHVLTETRRFSDAIGVFEKHPQFLEDPELRKVFSWSLYEAGQIVRCIEVAENVLLREHDPELAEILTNAYIAKGDWEKLPQQIENVWDKRKKLSAQELLQSAHLAQITGHAREKELVKAAISKSETDGFAFAGAYFLATKGGWEESEEVTEWLHRAISLSDDNGPMYRADLREIVNKQLDWNEHATRTMAKLRAAQCPIFVAAEVLNRHLIEFSLSHAEANKNEESRTSVKVIPSFSGKRPAIKIDEPRVGLDATCLMTLQSLGMLDAVFDHFDEVMLPHSTMSWLLKEISEVRYHQPSRVERAEAMCQLILDGKVSVCGTSPPRVTKLEHEIGNELAALVEHAGVDRSKGNPAFVVRGFPVSKAGSLGGESANLSGWDHLFVSTSSAVSFLLEQGRISIAKQKSATEYLALQETSWPEEAALGSGCICYLDDLTISYLQHLELLECFCDSGVKVMIGAGTHASASALQKRKRHLQKIEEHLVELRQSLSREITSGRVSILANDVSNAISDEDWHLWSHPTISVFGSATAPDAIVVDDRFLNRHDTFDRADAPSKVYKTLDILKTLQLQEKISENEYFDSLNALRERGHLFVPLEIEELRHHIKEAELNEGRLLIGRDLLQIKAYYLLARFSEWLTIPDDVHWLLHSNRLINDVIREQWKDVMDIQLAKAKSNWLFELVDLRIWASNSGKKIHRSDVEGHWVANIVGLLVMPSDTSRTEKQAYLAWLDEDVIQPLKHKHPQLFLQVVRHSRDLMENMLRANEERLNDGERKPAIAAAIMLESFPESVREALIAEQSFIGQFGLPTSMIVTFLPGGNRFSVEDLFDCAQSAFSGIEGIKISEVESKTVWTVCGVDQKRGTFTLRSAEKEIDVDGYWSVQAAAEDRLRNFETVASQVLLPCNRAKHWSAKLAAKSLSCEEVVAMEQDIKRSLVAVASKIRHEINGGSSNLQTLVPVDPEFWSNAYPVSKDTPALFEFVENTMKPWIAAGTKTYGPRFCAQVLRHCIHSSVAASIDYEDLSQDELLKLAEHVEQEGSMFSKLGFVEAVLAQPRPDPSILASVARIIDFLLEEPETGRFGLLSSLFFFVSGRLSLSAVFDETPAFVRRLVEFSHASFLEEILISAGVDAKATAFNLAQRVARRAFVVGHLDAHSEVRWMPEFAVPNQLKAEFVCRLSNALLSKEATLEGTVLEDFISEGSDRKIADRLKFPYSFLPGPLEGGVEQSANLPHEWRRLIEAELKKDPPNLGGLNGLVNSGAIFKLPPEITSLSVAALRRVDLVIDDDDNFSVGAFVDGLARVAAVCKSEHLAEEVWRLSSRIVQRKPLSLECETLFSLPLTLSAAFEVKQRDQKLCDMIDFFSLSRLSKQQSAHLDACLEDLLDMRPELWPRLGKASALLKVQQI